LGPTCPQLVHSPGATASTPRRLARPESPHHDWWKSARTPPTREGGANGPPVDHRIDGQGPGDPRADRNEPRRMFGHIPKIGPGNEVPRRRGRRRRASGVDCLRPRCSTDASPRGSGGGGWQADAHVPVASLVASPAAGAWEGAGPEASGSARRPTFEPSGLCPAAPRMAAAPEDGPPPPVNAPRRGAPGHHRQPSSRSRLTSTLCRVYPAAAGRGRHTSPTTRTDDRHTAPGPRFSRPSASPTIGRLADSTSPSTGIQAPTARTHRPPGPTGASPARPGCQGLPYTPRRPRPGPGSQVVIPYPPQ